MKKIFLISLFILSFLVHKGQHFEVGLLLGGANYIGDLSDNSDKLFLKETNFAAGAFAKYNFDWRWSARLGFNYATISGRDANARDVATEMRNLSFRSRLLEFSLIGEFNILGYQPYGMYKIFSPYVFFGVSATNFNPQANLQSQWIDLQPLGTEGQGIEGFEAPYEKLAFAIPFGFGVKYAINDKINIGLELGARRTFTDYLDDVSGAYVEFNELLAGNGSTAAALGNRTGELSGGDPVSVPTGTPRGDNVDADWFFIAGLAVSYNFMENGLMGSRGRSRSRKGCKSGIF